MASSLNIANKRLMLLNPKYVMAKRAQTGGYYNSSFAHYTNDDNISKANQSASSMN